MLVPYFTISSIVFLPKVTLSGLASRHVELSWGGYFHQLLYPGDNVIIFFWFLPTLFIIFCICLYASRLFRRSIPYLLVLIVLLLLNLASPYINIQLFSINSVAKYLFYFVLGYYFCKQGWIVYLNTKASIVVALTLFLSVCFVMSSTTFGVIAAINGIVLSIGISSLYIKYKISFFKSFIRCIVCNLFVFLVSTGRFTTNISWNNSCALVYRFCTCHYYRCIFPLDNMETINQI